MPKIITVSRCRLTKNMDIFGFFVLNTLPTALPASPSEIVSTFSQGKLSLDLFDEWLTSYGNCVRPVPISLVGLITECFIVVETQEIQKFLSVKKPISSRRGHDFMIPTMRLIVLDGRRIRLLPY